MNLYRILFNAILLFFIASMFFVTSCKDEPSVSSAISNANFRNVFRIKQQLVLPESEDNLLFSPSLNTTVTDKYIFLPLPKVNKILVFSRHGNPPFSIGKRGKGPLEFLNPVHIAYNMVNDTYQVVDAANYRVQFLDGDFNHQITLGFSYDLYKIFPVYNGFWFLSPHTFEGKSYLLLSYIDGEISHFLSYDKELFSFASWLGDFDGDQSIAICNAVSPEIFMFNIKKHTTTKIKIQGAFPGTNVFSEKAESLDDMQKKLQEFNKHPVQVMSLVLNNQNVFITIGGKEKNKFFLDVYNYRSELLYADLEIPGLLLTKQGNSLFFFNMHEFYDKPAEIRVVEAEWVGK